MVVDSDVHSSQRQSTARLSMSIESIRNVLATSLMLDFESDNLLTTCILRNVHVGNQWPGLRTAPYRMVPYVIYMM